MVTTRIITPDSVSSRSDQSTSTPPAPIQVAIGTTCALFVAQDVGEQHDAERHRQQQRAAGHELRAAVADRPAEKAGDRGGEQRQEDDERRPPAQPLIMWMSSTWIVPRLRK